MDKPLQQQGLKGWSVRGGPRSQILATIFAFFALAIFMLMAACSSPTSAPDQDTDGMRPSQGQAMVGHDMNAVNIGGASWAPVFARGQQPLEFTLAGDVREYSLTPQVVVWSILPTVQVGAYSYNGTIPGPFLRLNAGDRVRISVENRLPEPTSVHWHGLQIDNAQDGVAGVTQAPIQPGETFVYEWTVPPTPGTFFYHSHFQADRQQALGLYGALVIADPKSAAPPPDVDVPILLGEWKVTDQGTFPAMDFPGMEPNYFTINGKSYPETEMINVEVGQRVRLRVVGSGQFIHPMHLHGQPFRIVATDGNPVPEAAQFMKDTVLVGPGERYDLEFIVRAPGKWLFHCHINHHATNNGTEEQGGGGLTMIVNVSK
jgi:FtsP/CotA-like multicopper oxidase with cupredoxin domain